MITFDKLIKNFEKFEKQGNKLIEKEVMRLFEPIVYQVVLATRMDTGTGRASVGYEFAKYVKSQRIIDAIDYDVEVSQPAYFHWKHRAHRDPFQSYLGSLIPPLINANKIIVMIVIRDEGVLIQELGDFTDEDGESHEYAPSPSHPRPNPERHYGHHITEILRYVDSQNLDSFSDGSYFLPSIAKDIRKRVEDLYKKVEKVLFT